MAKIESVIFDMDGVIIDSRELIYKAMEDVLLEKQVSNVSREDMAHVTGKPVHAMYSLLAPHLDAYELERAHFAHHDANMHLLNEYPDVHTVLKELQNKNIKIGLFTGFNELTYSRLEQFDLRSYFEAIVESSQYTEHKPHPEGLLICMEKLSTTPVQTVYVGDGVSDIIAGKSGGVRAVVGITQGFGSQEALESAGADYIIGSLTELPSIVNSLQ